MPLILIVEDHAVIAETMAEYLRYKLNAEVHVVLSAEAMLREITELEPDVVLVDISLPQMNGIELIAELRQRYPEVPCLAVSGHTGTKYVRRARDAGVRGYIEKGDPDALVEAVQSILAGEIYFSLELFDR